MTRRARIAVLGGTFDHLHAGHLRLLDTAFRSAERVGIGITTDHYLAGHPKAARRDLQSFAARRRALERTLRAHYERRRWWTVPLDDGVGGALAPEVELLVASADTRVGAEAVNRERRKRGLRRLRLLLIPLATADDLLPLNSTRIRECIVDAHGRTLRPVVIARERGLPPDVVARLEAIVRAQFPPATPIRWVQRRPEPNPISSRTPVDQRAATLRRTAAYAVVAHLPRSGARGPAETQVQLFDASGPVDPTGTPRRNSSGLTLEAQIRRQLRGRRAQWVGRSTPVRPRR